jgi:hypothetical protein
MFGQKVQVRNEEGALGYFDTIGEAMRRADQDPSIWKISWTDNDTLERVRFRRATFLLENGESISAWVYEPILLDVDQAT